MFLAFFFKMFKEKKLDKVSVVFPDFEIIKNNDLLKFLYFFKFLIFSGSKSLMKLILFFILPCKNA